MLIIHFEFTYFLCDEVLYALFKKKAYYYMVSSY